MCSKDVKTSKHTSVDGEIVSIENKKKGLKKLIVG
jgi:hypothetical protein